MMHKLQVNVNCSEVIRSPSTYMNSTSDSLIKTIIKDNKTIEIEALNSKERIINTDHYCLGMPIPKPVHIR